MSQSTWHPSYWKNETHGITWDRVKEALRRDWEQTKADISGGPDLNQHVTDTVKQAAGTEVLPANNDPNPSAAPKPTWDEAEPAVRYGVAAREHFGPAQWDATLEKKLSTEWDDAKTGKPFSAVKPSVQQGWGFKK